jgi:predicted alpha/beta hydrolase
VIASEPVRIEASDGYSLAATVFRPPATRSVSGIAVVASAMGVRHPFYYPLAEYLAGRGAAVVCFDYRGIGGSRPARLRGFRACLRDWGGLDLAGVIVWSRERFPGRPVRVVAHSVSGQILGLATGGGEVDAALAVAAQSGYWRHWSGTGRLRVATLWFLLIPVLTRALGYFPSRWIGIGEDLPAGVAREWAYWGRHPDYVLGRVSPAERAGFEAFRGRIRAVRLRDDDLAPEPAVRALLDFYPNALTELRTLGPEDAGVDSIGHFGFFRERIGERVWPAEADWLLS